MLYGDLLAVYGVGGSDVGFSAEMCGHLMAKQIEVDPVIGGTAYGAAQHGFIEATGGGQILNGEGDVKGSD